MKRISIEVAFCGGLAEKGAPFVVKLKGVGYEVVPGLAVGRSWSEHKQRTRGGPWEIVHLQSGATIFGCGAFPTRQAAILAAQRLDELAGLNWNRVSARPCRRTVNKANRALRLMREEGIHVPLWLEREARR